MPSSEAVKTYMKWEPGTVVALTQAEVHMNMGDFKWVTEHVSGLWVLDEYSPVEPSNYSWTASWFITPEDHENLPAGVDAVMIDISELHQQIDPNGYGDMLWFEREDSDEFDFAFERGDLID